MGVQVVAAVGDGPPQNVRRPVRFAGPLGGRHTGIAAASDDQATVLYPVEEGVVEPGSLLENVTVEPGFEGLARRLLGHVVVGRDVTVDGVYRAPGLVRAGSDPRVRLAARRRRLRDEMAALQPLAGELKERQEEGRRAQARLQEIRSAAGQRRRLDEALTQLEAARSAEIQEAQRVPELEAAAGEARARAARLGRAVDAVIDAQLYLTSAHLVIRRTVRHDERAA